VWLHCHAILSPGQLIQYRVHDIVSCDALRQPVQITALLAWKVGKRVPKLPPHEETGNGTLVDGEHMVQARTDAADAVERFAVTEGEVLDSIEYELRRETRGLQQLERICEGSHGGMLNCACMLLCRVREV
jgi:hypothetical protein